MRVLVATFALAACGLAPAASGCVTGRTVSIVQAQAGATSGGNNLFGLSEPI